MASSAPGCNPTQLPGGRKPMSAKPLFSRGELAEMGRRTVDSIEAAIDAGDLEKAKLMARRMHEEAQLGQDLYCKWVPALLTFIGREYGDGALEKALRES